jgi:hypothetical protein
MGVEGALGIVCAGLGPPTNQAHQSCALLCHMPLLTCSLPVPVRLSRTSYISWTTNHWPTNAVLFCAAQAVPCHLSIVYPVLQ